LAQKLFPLEEVMSIGMSHRERVRFALEHRETDRIPIAMVCSGINPPAYIELSDYLQEYRGLSVEQYLHPIIDIQQVGAKYVGPALSPSQDIWGVVRRPVSYGAGCYEEIESYPLADVESIDDLYGYKWPTTDWFDYSNIARDIKAVNTDQEYCLMISGGNIFETAWYMSGLENMFTNMLLNPDLADHIMTNITDFFVDHTRKMLEAADGMVDLVFTADDIGGQEGLMLSLEMWEQQIKPHHVRLNQLIHEFGVKVIYHSDGAVMQAVPGLIDMGIDILQALQFDAKDMDPVTLKTYYGDKLCFEGGVSVQSTLPFGTVSDVEEEVRERIRVLGKAGGYILGPSHAIQAGTPPENIVAMFDTALEYL
jgi:uroporphyrinogen decarboxylase